jgi:DNA-binding CsgD family transcriptional regulator
MSTRQVVMSAVSKQEDDPRTNAMNVQITKRETEVLSLIAGGLTAARAARILNLSVHTVNRHVTNMIRRSGATNSVELVALAYHAGVLDLSTWPPCPARRSRFRLPLLRDPVDQIELENSITRNQATLESVPLESSDSFRLRTQEISR